VSARRAARGPGASARAREPAAPQPSAATRPHAAPPPRGLTDPWAWLTLLSALPLAIAMRGAPWGEPVAEDFDFLRRALFEGMGSLLDGGGSQAFWRPVPFQLYYAAVGRLILAAPALVTVLHLALLALGALLLYRALRPTWSGPLACAAATFTLLAEGTRTIAGWSAQFVDVAVFVASALAIHEASRRRWGTSLAALLVALLSKEVAVVTGLLLPFMPGVARGGTRQVRARERLRFAAACAAVLLAWGLASLAVRHAAGLEMPRHLLESPEAARTGWPARVAWAFHGSLRAATSLPRIADLHDPDVSVATLLLASLAVLVFALHRAARARLRRAAPLAAWGLAWFALATSTLAPLFPAWQSNRAHFGNVGLGVGTTAVLGAAHPALAGVFVAGRLALLEAAPGAVQVVTDSLPETGAFMDWVHLTRLQRFLRAARRTLAAGYPTLPHGAIVVQENLPHQLEYALGGDRALQAWYRDPTLRWMRFDAFRDSLETPVTVIVQGEAGRSPEVALVDPEAVRLLFRARPFIQSERYAEALVLLDRADSLQRDPNAVKYHVTIGAWRAYAWVETGRDSAAVALARRLVALDPEHLLLRQVLALGLSHLGRLGEALREIDAIEAIEPGDPTAAALRAGIDARLRAVRPGAAPRASPPAR
jgi:tetratricopeptide (TPR) repeat protein